MSLFPLPRPSVFELRIVKGEIVDEIIPHHHRARLGEHQVLLLISGHASGNDDDRDAKFRVREKLSGSAQGFLVLWLGRIRLVEQLLWNRKLE